MAARSKRSKSSKYLSAALLIIGAGLLFFAQSAYWVNHSVFNRDNFTQTTTTALLSESSRAAISTAVVDKALHDYPVLQRTIGQRAEALVGGLLGSDLSNQAVSALSSKVYAYTTSSDREDIKIDLTAVKEPISNLVALAQDNGREVRIDVDKIPDEIVLIEESAFPDFSGLVQLMIWLGPVLWLSTLAVFGSYIYLGRAEYSKKVYMVGLTIVFVGVLGLTFGPFVPPTLAAGVPNIELRPVVENLASGFLEPFKNQMSYMIGVALLALLAFNQRFNVLNIFKSVEKKISRS